ncbi:MAG TPA: STAS domain-containing protein [Candidatus Sulfopaludibacter sp.]|jgi:anti-sigma B factor antagonist|nr:STAS domain-containing protein [Candidatus Sulfopaludibacter sp.]
MIISVREAAATRIIDVSGDVDLGSSPNLRRALFDSLREVPKLALNLRALRYIDSSGIATLIEVLKDAQKLQKEFVLFGLSPAVRDVFHLTHVNRIFRIFESEEEAVAPA